MPALEVGVCADPAASTLPLTAADMHEASSRMVVAHSSGRISQFSIIDTATGQLHCAPLAWTGGRDDLSITRLRYFPWKQSSNNTFSMRIVAATLGGQLLVFDAETLLLLATVHSGGGAVHDLSHVIQFSASDSASLFTACGDGCVRRMSRHSSSISDNMGHQDGNDRHHHHQMLEGDQLFSKMPKANQAVSVDASAALGLVCFSDDIGNVLAHTIEEDRKKKSFAWNVSLPVGNALRVLIDARSNSVVVGTSANEVVFIDAQLGVFGARFRHHQAPVTALCLSSSGGSGSISISAAATASGGGGGGGLGGEPMTHMSDGAAAQRQQSSSGVTVYASGWHDLVRAYSCPSHRECSAYDFTPGQAKRQAHYHEVVEIVCMKNSLFSFSRDGTVMHVPIKHLFQPRRALYFDTSRGAGPFASRGPIVVAANCSSADDDQNKFMCRDLQFFVARPTAIVPVGSLSTRGPWNVKNVFLSRNMKWMAVTTDVGVSVFAIDIEASTGRLSSIERVFDSTIRSNIKEKAKKKKKKKKRSSADQSAAAALPDMPEPVGVVFTPYACIVASGTSLFRIRLVQNAAQQRVATDGDVVVAARADEDEEGASQQRRSRRRRARDDTINHDDDEDDGDAGAAPKHNSKSAAVQQQIVADEVKRYDLAALSPITGICTCMSADGQQSVFVTFAHALPSKFYLIDSKTDDIKVSAASSFTGPRGCIHLHVLERPGFDDEVVGYSTEVRSHVAIRAPNRSGHFYSARTTSTQLPATSSVLGRLPDTRSVAVGPLGISLVGSDGKFKATPVTDAKQSHASDGSSSGANNNNKHGKGQQQQPPPAATTATATTRTTSGLMIFPQQWNESSSTVFDSKNHQQEQQPANKKASSSSAKEDGTNNNNNKQEQIAAAVLSGVAEATVGDLASANTREDLHEEKASRSALMHKSPTVFLFERNLEKIISSLPPMWRVRKFGN